MQLILPDVIAAAKGLSLGASGFLIFVGLLLWSVGWRWHRFWVVFGITLAAGLVGLRAGQSAGGQQVMIVGVLLAVAAGMMALELAKILSFLTGGTAAWVAAQAVFPQAQELWAVFLSGGLLGVVLYRLWTMLTTSFVGVLVSWHFAIVLLEDVTKTDLVAWVQNHTAALNGGVIAVSILGVMVQTQTTHKPAEPAKEEEADDDDDHDDDHGHGPKGGHGKGGHGKGGHGKGGHDDDDTKASGFWRRVLPFRPAA